MWDLEKLGLTKAESRVYLLLMRHGTVTAGELAKVSRYSRPKVYEILDKLLTLGLVESFPGRPIKFRAFDPEVSMPTLFSSKRAELDGLEDDLTTALKDYFVEVPSKENEVFINQGLAKSITKYCELVKGARVEVHTVLGWVSRAEAKSLYYAFREARDSGAAVHMMWYDNGFYQEQVGGKWVDRFSGIADEFHLLTPEKAPIKNPPTKMLLVDDHSALIVVGDYLDDGHLKDVISVHYHNVPALSQVMKKLALQVFESLQGGGR